MTQAPATLAVPGITATVLGAPIKRPTRNSPRDVSQSSWPPPGGPRAQPGSACHLPQRLHPPAKSPAWPRLAKEKSRDWNRVSRVQSPLPTTPHRLPAPEAISQTSWQEVDSWPSQLNLVEWGQASLSHSLWQHIRGDVIPRSPLWPGRCSHRRVVEGAHEKPEASGSRMLACFRASRRGC